MLNLVSKINDYLELCKLNVVLLMLFSALVGIVLAPNESISWYQITSFLVGIGLVSGAGGTINQLLDKKVDEKMSRTKHRPMPSGSISSLEAICFAIILAVSGISILAATTNILAIYLTLIAMFGYAFIYTLVLKYVTPQNIVIGGITGALPPLIGWVCVTGKISHEPLLLVLIIYSWTPAHFWALAIAKYKDYEKSTVPMLPVTHGIAHTKRCILVYTLITIALSFLLFILNISGMLYLALVSALNCRYIYLALKLLLENGTSYAMPNFIFSINYLIYLFTIILVDHLIYSQ